MSQDCTMIEHPRAGQIFLQRYEIIEHLGSGGVGTVFKARQIDADRIIALKFLHQELAEDPATKARFIREAKALNKLQHDKIVSVYHLGETDNGLPYLAMEYIQGISLRSLILERPLPLTRAVSIAVQVCAALSYMHSCGVIHRDLKPDNIVSVQAANTDYVKIIDFGMVRFDSTSEQKLTSTGTVVGTVEYMSPEACRGLPTDARSDIYSLTVCLYEMILGTLPFAAGAPVELMYKHVHAPVPQLQNSGSNRLINEILRKGMAKNPEERFQTAGELKRALEGLIGVESDESITAHSGTNKKRWLLPVAIVMGIAAIAGSVMMLQPRPKKNKTKIVDQVTLKTKRKRLQDMEAFLARTDLGAAPKVLKALKFLDDNRDDADAEMLDLALETLNIAKSVPNPRGKALTARATYGVGEIYNSIGKCNEAIPYLEEASKISPTNLVAPGLTMGDYWTAKGFLATCYLATGRRAEAQALAREVASSPWQSGYTEALLVAIQTHDERTAKKLIEDSNSNKRLLKLGKICRAYGRPDLAKLCMDRGKNASITSEDKLEYGFEQIRLYISLGEIDKAKECMQNLNQSEDLSEYAWSKKQRSVIEIVSMLIRLNLMDEAHKIAFDRSSDKAKLKVLKADILAKRGDFSGARDLLANETGLKVMAPGTNQRVPALQRLAEMENQGSKGQDLLQMDELKF